MRHDEDSAAMHAPASGASSCPSPSTPASPADTSAPPAAAPELDGALLAVPARGEALLALVGGLGAGPEEDAGRPLTPASRWGGRVEADAAAAASSSSCLSSTAGRNMQFTAGRQVTTQCRGRVG